MNKIIKISLLSTSIISSYSFADSKLAGHETLALTHHEILDIYKDNNLVYDQNNMPEHYSDLSAISLTISRLQHRLLTIRDDVSKDYLYSGKNTAKSKTKLFKYIDNLVRISTKLEKVRQGIIDKPNAIDTYYSLSVTSHIYTQRILKQTKRLVKADNISSGFANEIHVITSILNDIATGYKSKMLTSILARGEVTSTVESTYSNTLNFKF